MYNSPYERMKITYYDYYISITNGKLIYTYNNINVYFKDDNFYIIRGCEAFKIKGTVYAPMVCKNKLMFPQEIDIKNKNNDINFCVLIFDLDTLLFQLLEIDEEYLKEFILLKIQ